MQTGEVDKIMELMRIALRSNMLEYGIGEVSELKSPWRFWSQALEALYTLTPG